MSHDTATADVQQRMREDLATCVRDFSQRIYVAPAAYQNMSSAELVEDIAQTPNAPAVLQALLWVVWQASDGVPVQSAAQTVRDEIEALWATPERAQRIADAEWRAGLAEARRNGMERQFRERQEAA